MLSRRTSFGTALAALVLSLQNTAQAQFFGGGGCGDCGPAIAAAPIAHCTPIQPVATTCYQTVPVTTYRQERQTVEVPTYETAYEEREVTVYRPVTQSREVEVPTVSYQNVTEIQTVNKDMGRWVTSYHPVAKCAPCQVDPRPGFLGWMNRTGYSMRTSFMPNYTTSRQYVPSMVTCQVPTTRQVAVQGTRRVTVQETKMVAERKSERVPVQRLVMKKQEVTVMRPQTAYRSVPIGTATAFGPYIGGSQMAFGYPIIESAPTTRSAQRAPEPDPAFQKGTFPEDGESNDGSFRRSENDKDSVNPAGLERSLRDDPMPTFNSTRRSAPRSGTEAVPAVLTRDASTPTIATKPVASSSGWRASRKTGSQAITSSSSDRPAISMADSIREK
jgi:hypothetical protein